MLLACDGGRLSCGSAAWRRLSSMAAVSRLYSTRRLGPIVLMWPGGFALLGSMAASLADYAGPAASRRWAAWRLLQPTIPFRRLRAAGQHGGFFSRLCRSGGFAPLGSMAASLADYAGPVASRRWAAWRLL